jgi:hypothetical protein
MSWPRPVAETRLLSWGLLASQGFIEQQRCRACWVNAIPLVPLADGMCRSTTDLDFEVSTLLPFCQLLRIDSIPSQALTPLQSFTHTPPQASGFPAGEPANKHVVRPSRGSFPFSVFPAARSHIPPMIPKPSVTLRPQGFARSRRFAPHTTCRACFIPIPLLGFALRGLHPPATPYAISDAGSLLGFRPLPKNRSAPPGHHTLREARPRRLGVNQSAVSHASLSFSLL